MSKGIVALSGGMDSCTVLAKALAYHNGNVDCIGFTYGSKHNKYEQEAAIAIAKFYMVPFDQVNLTSVVLPYVKSDLLRTGGDVPEGHYEAESMKQTVVPGRNIIFCSILAGIAWSREAEAIWVGIHAGDHHIYPDCRPEFYFHMDRAVYEGTDHKVRLEAPFLHADKSIILQEGFDLGTPYHLTRTCYKNQKVACGKCGSCQERLTAFKRLDREDPIDYETRELMPKE